MSNYEAQFEIADNGGRTEAFSGTATTSPVNIPAVESQVISGAIIIADGNNLEVSLDGGTTYFPLFKGENLNKNVKGYIKQIQVRTSAGTSDYRVLLDFEEY